MSTFLIILEIFAAVSFVLFVGVLDSKYYQRFHVEGLSIARDYVTILLVLMCCLIGLEQDSEPLPEWNFDLLSKWLQLVFHVSMVGVLAGSTVQFYKTRFKYARQYLLARASLYFSITFEVLALLIILALLTGFPW